MEEDIYWLVQTFDKGAKIESFGNMTRSDEKYLWNTAKSITHIHAPRQTQTLYTSSSLPPSCHHHHLNLVPVEATHIRKDPASLLTDDDPAVKENITTGAKTVSIL